MKLDQRTIQILKNFSTINPSIHFKNSNIIATISPTETILARAVVSQKFDDAFAIYDLSRFLSTLSLFSDPELETKEKWLTISQGKRKLNYTFTEPSLIVTPPDKEIVLKNPEVQFALGAENLQEVIKALSVLSLPEIAIIGDGKNISVQAVDSKNPTGDIYSVDVGETDQKFKMIIRAENMKLLPGDYFVEITSKGLSHFKGQDVEYWIAIEAHSTYSK